MKLAKDYFSDSRNGKYFPPGQTRTKLDQSCFKLFGLRLSSGELFIVDNDLDKRWFFKVEKEISDWSKSDITNCEYSAFGKIVKFHNVSDRTTYLIYKEK